MEPPQPDGAAATTVSPSGSSCVAARGSSTINSRSALIIAGPCGCGQATVGRELAAVLGLPFIEGDDLHPAANVAKMKRGEPLDGADRRPGSQRSAPRSAPARGAARRELLGAQAYL